jgi:hypothetical protein
MAGNNYFKDGEMSGNPERKLTGINLLVYILFLIPPIWLGAVAVQRIGDEINFHKDQEALLVAEKKATTSNEAFFFDYVRECRERPGISVDHCIEAYVYENPQELGFHDVNDMTGLLWFQLLEYQLDRHSKPYLLKKLAKKYQKFEKDEK